jgi:hypothetical protein
MLERDTCDKLTSCVHVHAELKSTLIGILKKIRDVYKELHPILSEVCMSVYLRVC